MSVTVKVFAQLVLQKKKSCTGDESATQLGNYVTCSLTQNNDFCQSFMISCSKRINLFKTTRSVY